MKSMKLNTKQEMKKRDFGSIYTAKGSRYLYISMYYFCERLRFPTDREDTPENREELREFLNAVGERIRKGTFQFAKTFYWLDQETKNHFSALEGREVKPEPEHVLFGEYAEQWVEKNIRTFFSVTKRRDYEEALKSRIIPHFGKLPFASITASEIEAFVENLKRISRAKDPGKSTGKPLSVKRIKNVIIPMTKIWIAACNDYNWTIRDPFIGLTEKYKNLTDRALQERERLAVLRGEDVPEFSTREVFLLAEWQHLLSFVDPHYHVVMDLLLMGMIGSELEALQKQHVEGDAVQIRCAIVREKGGAVHLKFKPKNWYRKREIPVTRRLRTLLDQAVGVSSSSQIIEFANGIALPANQFVLTMKDGTPFNYDSFRKTVWDKAMKKAGLEARVPYASRHTFIEWSLLIGVAKARLMDLTGHSNRQMIDSVYGSYRQGLVDEREGILDYLGEDFLALEELKLAFPERYRKQMAVAAPAPETEKAPVLASTFGQSFGQSQGLYADNYSM